MSLDHLTLNIHYDVKEKKFEVSGDVNFEGQRELVEGFLHNQIGAGRDDKTPDKKDFYNITLRWYPLNDNLEVSSDTGNKGLRDGILLEFLKRLDQ
ncbi:MAG TPA: hypothetical protein VJC39_00460 [Candidatus Nanoarchaeia archaeon]|nr:hypothetical protein [Candidatus Nanoarchaeia archaeon]